MQDPFEYREAAIRERELMLRLPSLVDRALQAPGWQRLLGDVEPAAIDNRAALAGLPVTRKGDLHALQVESRKRGEGAFGGLNATAIGSLSRLFMSPGPIFDPEGRGDDYWRCARALSAAGIEAGDIVYNGFSYHLTPGAWMIDGAARSMGCPVIPGGSGQTELQVEAIEALRPRHYCGTPSFLKLIIERAEASGADISSLKTALVSGEACPPQLTNWLREHGIDRVFQWYGTADLGLVAYQTFDPNEPTKINPGLIIDEALILEIVRPGTGDPVPDGEVGEIVVTVFNPDYPLIRFGTGDLSAIDSTPSPCGRTNRRIRGWLGRADQTTKVRGMFVHASQVDQVVKRFDEIKRARLVVEGELANDRMTLHCELADRELDVVADADVAALKERIAQCLREVTKLRGDVAFADGAGLPNDGKVIEDARRYD
ncbi:AMP-binding protein [soil metagenome]